MKPPPRKQSGNRVSTIASKALQGKKLTPAELKSLAGSVLSQDETKGRR